MDAWAVPDRGPIDVRISEPGEIAASLPHLLGFRPRESVVLISLTGSSGRRVGLTVRADIPAVRDAGAVARVLARSVCTDRPRGVLLAVVSEAADVDVEKDRDLPHRALVRELVTALARQPVPVPEVLLVRGGRWWSYDCPHECCAPDAGTPLPGGVPQLQVAAVATGMVVEADRDDLAARIHPPAGFDRGAMVAASVRAATECSAAVAADGRDATAEASWAAVTAAVARCRPGRPSAPLTDDETARILWGLRDVHVRDRALQLALGPDAAAAETLWTACTRRALPPLDAAPATLLAVSAWLRGDGAMANIALTRALDGDPRYRLARLLAQGLAACLTPAELRRMIRGTVDDRDVLAHLDAETWG
ncbi:DUF4192 domain-containing protein [Blastococcus sp. CT_GayMR20]|uniref:DUF4192 domain-containing protein n=1 Tax=Blastococcus sp. CT_GayMR20 TaxID=2559609 RepID=UPI0010739639|nr:DUF4192 domain-containing protein [Blastococcus sp. CT_GayMR20]TFV87678.1 DUF4192 domain-containing protein [Blastococcus sp. CT_GayMR20]